MDIELFITIVAGIVLANLINKTAVNPLLNKLFANASKSESGSGQALPSSACSKKLQGKEL